MNDELMKLAEETENDISEIVKKIDEDCIYNSKKVIDAFHRNNLSEMHFNGSTGYGHNDQGRDVIEKIFAEILGAEDSLVRSQFISGTHALSVSLFGLLRPGDKMLAISRKAL